METGSRRRYQRFRVTIPVQVDGVDKAGHSFHLAAETVNGCIDGLGLLLNTEPNPSAPLLVSIADKEHPFQIQTEIRHVTILDTDKNLVGVRFRGIQDHLSASPTR